MKEKEMICICCPLGCNLKAVIQTEKEVEVTGNLCSRGEEYAKSELTDPRRMVTTTVRIRGERNGVVSVKTVSGIPIDKIEDCIHALAKVELEAPVKIGNIVMEDVAGTGVDVVATRNYSG